MPESRDTSLAEIIVTGFNTGGYGEADYWNFLNSYEYSASQQSPGTPTPEEPMAEVIVEAKRTQPDTTLPYNLTREEIAELDEAQAVAEAEADEEEEDRFLEEVYINSPREEPFTPAEIDAMDLSVLGVLGVPVPRTPDPAQPGRRPRRSKPAPRRTRPTRPTRTLPPSFPRPRPGDPFPKFFKYVLKGFSKVFLPLELLFHFTDTGNDELGPDDRPLFALPPVDRERRDLRDTDPAGQPRPIADPLVEVFVTGGRPHPLPPAGITPDLAAFPIPDYGYNPFASPETPARPDARPSPDPELNLEPWQEPSNEPYSPPERRPSNRPLPLNPFAPPTPEPFAPLNPTLEPFIPPTVRPGPTPIKPTIPTFLDPVPPLGPIPKEDLDRCNCPRPRKKKKDDEKKERTTCFQYKRREFSDGSISWDKKLIACEPKSSWLPAKKKPKPKTTNKNPFPQQSAAFLGVF